MDNTQHFCMCIFNLIKLISNLDNIKKKKPNQTMVMQIIFSFTHCACT